MGPCQNTKTPNASTLLLLRVFIFTINRLVESAGLVCLLESIGNEDIGIWKQ